LAWNMKLNPDNTKILTIRRPRTHLPQHGDHLLGGSVDRSQSLVVLGVTLGSKLTFEAHNREVMSSSSRALGIIRKAAKIVPSPDVLGEMLSILRPLSIGVMCACLGLAPQRAVTCASWME
jgi:hypothetical protein